MILMHGLEVLDKDVILHQRWVIKLLQNQDFELSFWLYSFPKYTHSQDYMQFLQIWFDTFQYLGKLDKKLHWA